MASLIRWKIIERTLYYKVHILEIYMVWQVVQILKGRHCKSIQVPFSQFVKVENEFRHYLKLGKESVLASRIIAVQALR
jgi:hypothetical protein